MKQRTLEEAKSELLRVMKHRDVTEHEARQIIAMPRPVRSVIESLEWDGWYVKEYDKEITVGFHLYVEPVFHLLGRKHD